MTIIRYFILFSLTCILASSCSSIMVSQDYDLSTSFSEYAQFSLEKKASEQENDPQYDNELINERFSRAITTRLQEKGFYHQVNPEKSDFEVSFNYVIQPKMDIYNISKQLGFSYQSYHRYGGVGARTCTDISEFDQGILIIDIKNNSTRKLIWRGTATDIISIYATPEKITAQVEEMVTAVLRNFPPQ